MRNLSSSYRSLRASASLGAVVLLAAVLAGCNAPEVDRAALETVPASATSTAAPTSEEPAVSPFHAWESRTLHAGESVFSADGRFELVHQTDGNVVLYGPAGAVWSTRTTGAWTHSLRFQPDGNLVLYDLNLRPLWHTRTGQRGDLLAVQGDANLVVYTAGGTRPVWAIKGLQPPVSNGGTPAQNRELGRQLAAARGWGSSQFSCLDALWSHESGWSTTAANPSSSAYGIPQALPGSKMGSHGADWRTNPRTQIRWGLDYIGGRYGTPCSAYSHSRSRGWY